MHFRLITILWVFLICSVAFSLSERSRVDLGYSYLMNNQPDSAFAIFQSLLPQDQTSERIITGYLLSCKMLKHEEEAMEALIRLSRATKSFYPYLLALQITDPFFQNMASEKFGKKLEKPVTDLLHSPLDSMQQGNALLNEWLLRYYQRTNDYKNALAISQKSPSVFPWMIIGPFENISGSGMDKVFPPEQQFSPDSIYPGKNRIPASWEITREKRLDQWLDFTNYFSFQDAVYYANLFAYSPDSSQILLRLGFSGALALFLNDVPLFSSPTIRNTGMDAVIIQTRLEKGWNRLLVKLGQQGNSPCNFSLRITDLKGNPKPGLVFSLAPKNYPSGKKSPHHLVENRIIRFFTQKIRQYPDHPENYLFLIHFLLQNDDLPEAKRWIAHLRQWYPHSTYLYELQMEYHLRNNEPLLASQIADSIMQYAPESFPALSFQIRNALDSRNLQQAWNLLEKLVRLYGKTREFYQWYAEFLLQINQPDECIALLNEGLRQFPHDWNLVSLRSSLAFEKENHTRKAILLVDRFRKKTAGKEASEQLIQYYLKMGMPEPAIQVLQDMSKWNPADPSIPLRIAQIYFHTGDVTTALKTITKAAELCPNSSIIFEWMGDMYSYRRENENAIDALRKAIRYAPTNYTARDKLFALSGDSPLQSVPNLSFSADKMISQTQFGSSSAVILLHQHEIRIIFPEGASETVVEEWYQIRQSAGSSYFQPYQIKTVSTEDILIDYSEVIKPDGKILQGEAAHHQIFFPPVKEGDLIHIRYKKRDYYFGSLFGQFWGEFFFDREIPVLHARFSLLVPQNHSFSFISIPDSLQPDVQSLKEYKLYQWEMDSLPPIVPEPGQIPLPDIQKKVLYSSIPDWNFIARWYLDLSHSSFSLSPEMAEELSRLFPDASLYPRKEFIRRLFRFLATRFRYTDLPLGKSALIPQKASVTFRTGEGDCKDLSTLFVAICRFFHIPAYLTLVKTRNHGSHPLSIPDVRFNHVIVAVKDSSDTLFLDPTAFAFPPGILPPSLHHALALIVHSSSIKPVFLPEPDYSGHEYLWFDSIQIHQDFSAEAKFERSATGIYAARLRSSYGSLSSPEIKKKLTQYFSEKYGLCTVLDFRFDNLHDFSDTVKSVVLMKFPQRMYTTGQTVVFPFIWGNAFLYPEELFEPQERTYPFYFVPFPGTEREEVVISFPENLVPLELPANVSISNDFFDYTVSFSQGKNGIRARRIARYKKSIILPEQYSAFRKEFGVLLENERFMLIFKKMAR